MKSILQFMETDCQLLKPIQLFIGLHAATNGDPCTTGCAYFNGGKCAAYRTLNTVAKATPEQHTETVREMAARLGISISEARRRRAA